MHTTSHRKPAPATVGHLTALAAAAGHALITHHTTQPGQAGTDEDTADLFHTTWAQATTNVRRDTLTTLTDLAARYGGHPSKLRPPNDTITNTADAASEHAASLVVIARQDLHNPSNNPSPTGLTAIGHYATALAIDPDPTLSSLTAVLLAAFTFAPTNITPPPATLQRQDQLTSR